MSPEQATGTKDIDARSDLYSLGCVLYEMLSGDAPYTASTPQALIAKKLSEATPRVSVVRDKVPPAVEAALDRALSRTPADRFATAEQFSVALYTVGPATPPATRPLPAALGRRRWLAPGVLAAIVVLIGIGVVLSRVLASRPITITTSNILHVTSDPGLEFQPALSPDGNEVAYVVGPIGTPRIVVRSTRDVGSGGESHPAEGTPGLQWLPAWTPDGQSLRFAACGASTEMGIGIPSACDWKEVGKLGGSVRKVSVPRPSDRHAWSKNGMRVAFAVGDSLFAYSSDRGEPELLGVQVVGAREPHSLNWSPDGRLIAYVNGNSFWRKSANVAGASIWILDVNGGHPVRVTDDAHLNVSPQWLPDSRHLLFVSDRDGSRGVYVVEVGLDGPRGPPRSVLSSSDPHSISLSADGRKLAYAKFRVMQNIWSIPIPRSGSVSIRGAVPVTTGNQVIEGHSLSPDGEWIVFSSDKRGEFDIYKQPLGDGQAQLVADFSGHLFDPIWSPDGTEIVLHSGGINSGDVLVVSADGGTPEELTDFPGAEGNPDFSPDGLAIAFSSQGPRGVGPMNTWIVSRDGVGLPWGDPVQLTDSGCGFPTWAPDGASLGCAGAREWERLSRDGEVLLRYDPSSAGLGILGIARFSPDGSRIYFRGTHEGGSEGVWWIPADGGDATKVVAIDDPSLTLLGFLSVNSTHLYLTIAEYESDIWVMDLEW
jgi:Tol biopolymer transport system component